MANAPPVGNYRHILQATDLSDGSRQALQRFRALGIGERTRHSLLHVFDAPAQRLAFGDSMPKDEQQRYLTALGKDALDKLSRFAVSAKLGHVEPMVRHEATTASHDILKVAEEAQADLIVLSTQGRTGVSKLLLGSVTEEVLRIAPVDVLAIPPVPKPYQTAA